MRLDWILDQKNDISGKTGKIQIKPVLKSIVQIFISVLEKYTTIRKDINNKGILFLYL